MSRIYLIIIIIVAYSNAYSLNYNDDAGSIKNEPLGLLLTWQQDPTSTMTIDWHTFDDSQSTLLEYKKLGTDNWENASGENFPFPFSDRIVHRVELTGLDADTEYRFRFGESSRIRKFRTMPNNANRPIRFAAGGDVRTSKERMERTNRLAASYNPDFILWGGDLAYADGREDRVYRWYEFMDAAMNTLVTTDGRIIPVLTAIGNHEVRGAVYDRDPDHETREGLPTYTQDDESRELMAPYYYNLFAFPGQPGYGVLDFGNYMSIILLDTDHSNPVDGKQTEWLNEILADRQRVPHLFPIYHVPAWPSVRNPEGSRHIKIRENWVPLFEENGVQVVFENHDHVYKRTYPLYQGEISENGIVYIGDGAWGVGTRQIGGSQNPDDGWQYHGNNPWYLKRASSERHFILGTIHGTHRHFLMVNEEGKIIDEFPRTTHTDHATVRLAEPWMPANNNYAEPNQDNVDYTIKDYSEAIDLAIQDASLDRPRVLLNSEDFNRLRERIDKDEATERIYLHFKKQADEVLELPLLEREQIGRRMLSVSREALRRVTLLGTAWQITGEQHYADRIKDELMTVCQFFDWNPSHFLDTAEMTLAVSIGYDWAYDVLDTDTRSIIRTALVEKGLKPGFDTPSRKWTTNWGQVVNAGLAAGAIAVLDEEPEVAREILQLTIHDVRNATSIVYGTEGNYMEGSSYWEFGTFYHVIMTEVLESGLGSDFGLIEEPGFRQSGNYILHVTGPSLTTFQWHFERRSSNLIWFAQRFGTPLLPKWSHEAAFNRGESLDIWGATETRNNYRHPFALLWLPDDDYEIDEPPSLDWYGRGPMQVAMHRSSWNDPNALFLGIKAGIADHSHGFLDAGDFILESAGVRWARDRVNTAGRHPIEERGMNLWNYEQDSDRWKIFYKNNFSHNTLVINNELQIAAGQPEIVEQFSTEELAYTIVDLSEVYEGQAEQVHRTFGMLERRAVIIIDEINGLEPGAQVRWAMVTDASVTTDGQKAVLEKGGKQLQMEITGPDEVSWNATDMAEPPAEWDASNPESTLLNFIANAPQDGKLRLEVRFLPEGNEANIDESWWQNYLLRL